MELNSEWFDLTDDHLKLLGLIAVNAAQIEYRLANAIGDLIDPESMEVGLIMTGGLTFDRLATLSISLARTRFTDDHPATVDLIAAVGLARDAMLHRNRMLHGDWLGNFGQPGAYLLTRERKGYISDEYITIERLRAIVSEIVQAGSAVNRAFFSIAEAAGRNDVTGLLTKSPPPEANGVG